MNQCPPGSQGVRGQLSTGPSGSLDFGAVDRKEIFPVFFIFSKFSATYAFHVRVEYKKNKVNPFKQDTPFIYERYSVITHVYMFP